MVEDSLLEYLALESAGVVGIHDLVNGENVRAYITFRQGVARPTTGELIQISRVRVGYKAPDEFVVLDDMPNNAVGKVDWRGLETDGRHGCKPSSGLTEESRFAIGACGAAKVELSRLQGFKAPRSKQTSRPIKD